MPLLDDLDAAVRTRTLYLLSWFPEDRIEILPALAARVAAEQDSLAKATALVGVGLLGTSESTELPQDELDSPEPLIRWAAATALSRVGASQNNERPLNSDLMKRVFNELADFAAHPQSATHRPQRGQPARLHRAHPSAAPRHRPDRRPAHRDRELRAEHDRVAVQPPRLRGQHQTFDISGIDPAPVFVDLSRGQQQIILALADHPEITSFHTYAIYRLPEVLQAAGLPEMGQGLRGYAWLPINLRNLTADETWAR